MAPVVSMKQLLEAGVHFGHQTRRWNPKMKRFILGERNGIYIIDLQQTLQRIEAAYTFVRDLVADGGDILFIGTKKQAQDQISAAADGCGMPYINERWLGGMLTNFSTISGRVAKMTDYQRQRAVGDFDAMPKKEALMKGRELEKLERNLGGIRNMSKLPDAVFIIDTNKEHIGVTEANKLKIPVVAVVDTNCDPDLVDFVIPGNDDAIRSGTLMCRIISDAVKEGRYIAERRGTAKPAPPAPPTPEEEAERARVQAAARAAAAQQAAEREARVAAAASPVAEGSPEETSAVAPSQSSDAIGATPGGEPEPGTVAPQSDALEPEKGAVPAPAPDSQPNPEGVAALPGSAGTVPVGSHGGQGMDAPTGDDQGVAEDPPAPVSGQQTAEFAPREARETPGAFGPEGGDAGDPGHPKTDKT
jgi:small subunit ribosomal protein S2